MKMKKVTLNTSTKLYIYALILFLIRHIVFGTAAMELSKIFSYGIYGLIGTLLMMKFILFFNKASLKTAFWVVVLLVTGIGMTILTKNPSIIFVMLFLILATDVSFSVIARYTYITISITCFLIVLLVLIGVIENRVFYREDVPKYALGFIYVGVLNNYFLHYVILRIFEKRDKIKWKEIIAYFGIAFIIYLVSRVKGDFYLTIGVILLTIVFVKWNIGFNLKRKIWKLVSVLYMPFMCFLSMCITVIFTPANSLLWSLNTLLSDRLRIANRAFLSYGFNPFAKQIEWIGSTTLQNQGLDKTMYNYVDNAYIQVGIEYGLIFLALIIIAYSTLFYYAVKNENKFLCLWIMITGVECLIYPSLISIPNNLLIIYSISVLIGNKKAINKLLNSINENTVDRKNII